MLNTFSASVYVVWCVSCGGNFLVQVELDVLIHGHSPLKHRVSRRMPTMDEPSSTQPAPASPPVTQDAPPSVLAKAVAACRLGILRDLKSALSNAEHKDHILHAKAHKDGTNHGGSDCHQHKRPSITGRTCLHYAAGYGHEELVSLLLDEGASPSSRDLNLDTPLHLAASSNQPHALYNLVTAACDVCLVKNLRGKTPIDIAADCSRSEVWCCF